MNRNKALHGFDEVKLERIPCTLKQGEVLYGVPPSGFPIGIVTENLCFPAARELIG